MTAQAPNGTNEGGPLHALEEFQSRIHSDPNDKPDEPPILDATQTRSPNLTLTWQEIPSWQKDNEFILTGYRRIQNNWRGCAASVFGCTLIPTHAQFANGICCLICVYDNLARRFA